MYTLHYAPDNASLVVRLVLDGAGIPYLTALVDRARRAQDSPAYRALNPVGLIPVLETAEGPISETAAILLWLSDRHRLGPAPADAARGTFLRWLFYLSNTVHADLRMVFYPHQYAPANGHAAHHEITSARLLRHFALVDRVAAAEPALFAPARPLGAYAVTLTRWAALYPPEGPAWFDLARFPVLTALARAQEARVETAAIARAEGLGPHPFTRPEQPKPPEGAVL
jgi:glutathione S-transferase